MGHGAGLPPSLPEEYESNEELLKAAHHVLMEVDEFADSLPLSQTLPFPHTLLSLTPSSDCCPCRQVEVIEGELECPESGRRFPVEEGIPNMLLREDEV